MENLFVASGIDYLLHLSPERNSSGEDAREGVWGVLPDLFRRLARLRRGEVRGPIGKLPRPLPPQEPGFHAIRPVPLDLHSI